VLVYICGRFLWFFLIKMSATVICKGMGMNVSDESEVLLVIYYYVKERMN